MKTYGRKLVPITVVGILAIIGYLITNSRQAAAQGPPGGGPGLQVNIVGPSPLPVTGTVNVGNFANITTAILVNEINVPVTSEITSLNPVITSDVSGAKTIRLNVDNGSCVPCSEVDVKVFSNNILIDVIKVEPNTGIEVATRVYEVPGTVLQLKFANPAPGFINRLRVEVFARSN